MAIMVVFNQEIAMGSMGSSIGLKERKLADRVLVMDDG
jgi:hypothetical protein